MAQEGRRGLAVADSRCVSGAVRLAIVSASRPCRASVCGLWGCLCQCGDPVVVAGSGHPSNGMGSGRGSDLPGRDDRDHARGAPGLKPSQSQWRLGCPLASALSMRLNFSRFFAHLPSRQSTRADGGHPALTELRATDIELNAMATAANIGCIEPATVAGSASCHNRGVSRRRIA